MPLLRLRTLALAALAALAATLAGAGTSVAQTEPGKRPAETNLAAIPEIVFYLAHGEANACGRGCDQWIAAEGKIDPGAAQRLRRLLAKLGRRRPPIYFHSPGGSVTGSLELGRLLRAEKFQVSVAQTLPLGCDRDRPFATSCLAQKRSGRELKAELDPTRTMCNSGCVYALAGGVVRIVPPQVKLAIHDVGFEPSAKLPRGALLARARSLLHARIEDYLRDMGIDHALYTAAVAVPFESRRVLARAELARFGIDRRDFGETRWWFIDKPKPVMFKSFFVRTDKDFRYLDASMIISCGVTQQIRLGLARVSLPSEAPGAGPRPVSIDLGGQSINLPYQTRASDVYLRSASLPAERLAAIGDGASVEVPWTTLGRDDGPVADVTLSMDGFSAAYATLRKSCDDAARDIAAGAWTKPAAVPFVAGSQAAQANGPPPIRVPTVSIRPPAAAAPWPKPAAVPFVAGSQAALAKGPPPIRVPTVSIRPPAAAPPAGALRAGAPPAGAPPAGVPDAKDEAAAAKPKDDGTAANAPPGQSQASAQSCALNIDIAPAHVRGRVTAFVPREEASAMTRTMETRLGATISPAYSSLTRVKVEADAKNATWSTLAAIPEHVSVQIGDLVELNGRYRDPQLPCHFIPWTVDHVVEPTGSSAAARSSLDHR